MDIWIFVVAVLFVLILTTVLVLHFRKRGVSKEHAFLTAEGRASRLPTAAATEIAPVPITVRPPDLTERMSRTRGLFGSLEKFWSGGNARALQEKEWEEIEEALLLADVGLPTTQQLIAQVRNR